MDIRILNHIDRNIDDYFNRIKSLNQCTHVHTDTTYYMKKRDDYRYTGLNDNFFSILQSMWFEDRLLFMHDDLEFKDYVFEKIEYIDDFL